MNLSAQDKELLEELCQQHGVSESKLWKSLLWAYLGDYEKLVNELEKLRITSSSI